MQKLLGCLRKSSIRLKKIIKTKKCFYIVNTWQRKIIKNKKYLIEVVEIVSLFYFQERF